jgi:hypothetical protein
MEGRGILETPEMLSGLEAGIAGMIPAMQQKNLGSGPKTLEGPINIQPEFDQYGQPRMHTPGMAQVQVPNPNYGIDPATNKTPNQYLPGIGYINVTGNAETTLPGQPAPGVAAGIAGMIPAMGETRPALYDPRQRAIDEGYQPGSGFMYEGKFYESGNPGRVSMDMAPLDSLFANNPAAREAFKESGMKLVMNPNPNPQAGQQLLGPDGKPMQPFTGDASPVGGPAIDFNAPIGSPANPFGPQEGVMPELDNIGLITDAPGYNPVTPQQPTGGFDSKAFANELLTGIGDLFKQHFPESAQMAFNNSNQMQSQIEQPIQDATTFDVQPQQNMAFNPFSVNTLGGSFGGGY